MFKAHCHSGRESSECVFDELGQDIRQGGDKILLRKEKKKVFFLKK